MTVAHERKERSAKARLGYLWFSSFLRLKITLSSDVKGWWCCEYHPACDGKRFSLCPKGALTGFVSFPLQVCSTAASPASRVCLWLLHFLFWTFWSVLSWRRNKFNCPARAEMESRFAVYQTLHQLLQRQALRTSVRRRRRVRAGGSHGLVCCWWSQAKEQITGESLLLVSISPELLCLNHGYCAQFQHDRSGDCRCLFSQLLPCVVSIALFLIHLSCARFIILASVPKSSSLKRWELISRKLCLSQ